MDAVIRKPCVHELTGQEMFNRMELGRQPGNLCGDPAAVTIDGEPYCEIHRAQHQKPPTQGGGHVHGSRPTLGEWICLALFVAGVIGGVWWVWWR